MPLKLIEFVAALCALMLPVNAVVADSFRAPSCTWCAGNRGIEYVSVPSAAVYSAATGVVTFSGRVAGTVYVVVRGTNDVLVTHGRLQQASVKSGDRVTAGFRIGESSDRLYIGVRHLGQYLNPETCAVMAKNPSGLRPRAVLLPIHSQRP